MPGFLKQSTASQSRAIGPFVDSTDFLTPETGLTIANTDIKLVVNGGASANKNSGGGTHRVNGVYGVTFDATDTATVGEMEVSVVVAGALPVFDKFFVLEEAVYDAFFAASALGYVANAPVNVAQLSGDSTAADNAEAFFDGTGYAGTGNVIPTVTTLTGHTPQTGDNFARLGAPAGASVSADIAAVKTDTGNLVTRIPAALFSGITSLAQWLGLIAGKQTGNSTARTELRATGAGSGTFDETTDSTEAIRDRGDSAWSTAIGFSTHSAADVWAVATRTLTAFDSSFKTGYALSSAGVQAIWDALTSALTTVGSIGKLLVDNVNATISSRSSHAAADVWAVGTRTLTAGTNIVLAKGTGVTGFNDPTATENADALLARDLGSGTGAGTLNERTVRSALRFSRNKFTIAGGVLTVYREDDTTVAFTATITQTAGDPVSASDPA